MSNKKYIFYLNTIVARRFVRCYTVRMKIILSNSAHGAYRRVLDCLRSRLADGGEHVVIVPDKFTATSERGVLDTLGIDAAFNVGVTSFTRLAEKTVGRNIKKCLTPQGSVMLLAKVIEDRRSELVYYGKAARVNGFADEFYAALTAVRNSGVTAAALRAAACEAPPSFKDKLNDIALIYDAYIEELSGRHSDSSTRLEAFADYLKRREPEATHYYVVDFYDFKAPELDILAGLDASSLSVTVGLVGGFGAPNARIYCDGVAERVKAACGGAETEIWKEALNPVSAVISERLFSYDPPSVRTENGGKVRLARARGRTTEIVRVVSEIRDKVMEGARYRDFELVLSDPDAYIPELKAALLRYGVPFFIDTRERLAEQTKVRYVLSAIAAVRSGYRRAEVTELVKNPLFYAECDGGADDVFAFENYVLRYNVDYARFSKPFVLGGDGERARAEKVRLRLCEVCAPFVFTGAVTAADFADRAASFLEAAESAWRNHTAKLTEMSLYYAKCAEQVDEKTKAVFDEMREALNAKGRLAYFENIFKSMLRSVKIALVPTFLDAVYVGGTDNRYLGRGDVYVLGANVGKLPAVKGGGAVVSPRDEDALAALGVKITPARKERVYAELMAVTEIMKRPRGSLVISFPESGASGELRPSSVISEMRGMLGENGTALSVEYWDDRIPYGGEARRRAVRAKFSTPRACYHEILRGAARDGEDEIYGAARHWLTDGGAAALERVYARRTPPERLTEEAAGAIAADGVFSVSASRLEKYFTCPYAHYMRYVLRLEKREEAGLESTDSGTILHAVLEGFFREVRDRGMTEDAVDDAAARLFDEAVRSLPRVAAAAEEPETRRALVRLREESAAVCRGLYAASLRSEYKPLYLEEKIGGEEIMPLLLEVGGRKTEVRGYIDRVDVLDGKFAVVDYKTYKSAELRLPEIYTGERIQLYVYLRAIEKSKGWKPVGAFYLPVHSGFIEEDEVRFKYRGHILRDDAEAVKLDSAYNLSPESSILPYKHNARSGKPADDVHLTEESFEVVAAYVERKAAEGAEGILNGTVRPDPIDNACEYCDYAGICGYAVAAGRSRPAVKIADFETKREEE